MTIEWRPISGFPDYEVSNTGLVRSHKRSKPHILRPSGMPSGHQRVILSQNGKQYSFTVGKLVLLAFKGPCPENCEMCHNDGDPTNDHLDNLRWDTHAANMRDAGRHWSKRHVKSRTPKTVKNRAFVNAIAIIHRNSGMTQGEFAKYLGFSRIALFKLYTEGVKDGVIIKILRKYPYLANLF